MSLEAMSTAAAIGTFVVIGATAIAAVVQLRHLRASNQLQGLLTVLSRVEDANFNQWVSGARRVIAERLPDPAYRKSIVDGTFDTIDNPWLNLGNSYEWVGSLVRQGLISEKAFMDIYSSVVIRAWHIMEDVTALRRREKGPAIWENFEYIYMRAEAWEVRFPNGMYPGNMPRARITDRWLPTDNPVVS